MRDRDPTPPRPARTPPDPGRAARTLALALLAVAHGTAGAADPAAPPERLAVLAQVRSPSCYVGQTVDVFVGVVGDREAPKFSAPDVPGAVLTHAGTDLKPLGVSGIGDVVAQRLLYRARYRLVPRRAGTLTVPPFTARLGERRGASEPLRLSVRKPPEAGRPAEFLGGVGDFDADATAEPTSVRLGQALDYRVTVSGPAARGVAAAPDVTRLGRLPLGVRVERRPDVVTDDPPEHTFVFRLRPTRAGEATLPPLRIAAFDPETSRYLTRATPGVPIRVTDVPRFDPSALDYGRTPGGDAVTTRGRIGPGAVTAAAAALGGVALALGVAAVRTRGRADRGARRACRVAVGRLERASTDADRGRAITEGLAAYLERATGRPPGALTPADARAGVALATGSDDLAARAERLIARCDAARFGTTGSAGDDLGAAGRAFFRDVGAAGSGGAGGGKTR